MPATFCRCCKNALAPASASAITPLLKTGASPLHVQKTVANASQWPCEGSLSGIRIDRCCGQCVLPTASALLCERPGLQQLLEVLFRLARPLPMVAALVQVFQGPDEYSLNSAILRSVRKRIGRRLPRLPLTQLLAPGDQTYPQRFAVIR